jgi:hypothetical protein
MPVGDAMVRFDRATMAVRNARIIGSARDDETILKESGYRDANDYWQTAMSQTMRVPTFVWLLESHLEVSDRTHWRQMPISALIRLALQEAWEAGENWFIARGISDFTRARLRPRDASLWLLSKPLYGDRVPATLRVYLEAGERPGRTASARPDVSAPPKGSQVRGGRSRERREQVKKILTNKFPPHGQPPGGRFTKALVNNINDELVAKGFNRVGKDTCRRARDDLKSESR